MEEIGGTYLQPLMVNMSHIIGKQVVKLLQDEKCSTHTIKEAPLQKLPIIQMKWILNNNTFTTSTRPLNT